MHFNQTKQDRMQIFKEVLFSKLSTKLHYKNKQFSDLLPVGFLQKEEGTRLIYSIVLYCT